MTEEEKVQRLWRVMGTGFGIGFVFGFLLGVGVVAQVLQMPWPLSGITFGLLMGAFGILSATNHDRSWV